MRGGLKNSLWRLIALSALASAIVITCALLTADRLAGQTGGTVPINVPLHQLFSFGMVGIVQGQTARLNVVNPSDGTSSAQLPCQLALAFLDSQGKSLKNAAIDNLEAGKAVFLDLDWTEIPGASNRVEIRATVTTNFSAPLSPLGTVGAVLPQRLSCSALPTLEVFDNDTNKTTVILSGPSIFLGPLPLAATAAPAPSR